MRTSDSIKELATALAKAQSEFPKIVKDAENPYFKSKYADLATIIGAVQDILGKHGIAIFQPIETEMQSYADSEGTVTGERVILCVITLVAHVSGEFMESTLKIPLQDSKPQTLGSASSYARRYALQSVIRVAAELDDDGNAASLNENWPKEKRDKLAQDKIAALKKEKADKEDKSPFISDAQGKMLWAISKKLGLSEGDLRDAVKTGCGTEHIREIRKEDFQKLLNFIDPDFKYHEHELTLQG